jgi:hypothetical protein
MLTNYLFDIIYLKNKFQLGKTIIVGIAIVSLAIRHGRLNLQRATLSANARSIRSTKIIQRI